MKKIFFFVSAMLVALAVSADPVVLPATLDVTNVSYRSEGMPDFVIEEGQDYAGTYFDMGATKPGIRLSLSVTKVIPEKRDNSPLARWI